MADERLLDKIKKRPVLTKLNEMLNQGLTKENLTDEQGKIIEAFKLGLADAIGIPVDNIDGKKINSWILTFSRAFIKEDHLNDTVAPPLHQMRSLGNDIGHIVREAIEKIEKKEPEPTDTDVIDESKTETIRDRIFGGMAIDS